MKVIIGSNIQVREPSRELMKYCNDRLILINPEYVKKMRMGFWLGKTPQTISLFEKRGDTLVLPFGTLRTIWPLIKDASPETAFTDPQSVDFGGVPVPLYDYQETALEVLYRAKYGILQSAAGSGKTQMGIALVKRYQRPALWITHTADLLNQSKERAALYVDPAMIGTITDGKVNIGRGITFATVQTLSKLDLLQYRDLWDVIIVDECHHVSGSPTTVTQFYKVLGNAQIDIHGGGTFGLYRAPNGYIIHGEIEIIMVSAEFEVVWRFSGRDIFVSITGRQEITLTDNTIQLFDFEDNFYEIDYQGRPVSKHTDS